MGVGLGHPEDRAVPRHGWPANIGQRTVPAALHPRESLLA